MSKVAMRLLREFARTFAKEESDGHWWGYDTDLGDCAGAFRKAEFEIGKLKREQYPHKRKLRYSNIKRREAVAKAVWGEKVPAWWKGSMGEAELLEMITSLQERWNP